MAKPLDPACRGRLRDPSEILFDFADLTSVGSRSIKEAGHGAMILNIHALAGTRSRGIPFHAAPC
jgi:hypothetical protein